MEIVSLGKNRIKKQKYAEATLIMSEKTDPKEQIM